MGCIQGCDKGAGWASIGYRVVGVDRGPGFTGALVPQIDPKGIRKESERNPKGIRKENSVPEGQDASFSDRRMEVILLLAVVRSGPAVNEKPLAVSPLYEIPLKEYVLSGTKSKPM